MAVEKELVRIQMRVAEEFEDVAMYLVGSALQDGVNVASAIAALGGIIKARLHFELLNDVGTWQGRVRQFRDIVIARGDALDLIVVVIFALSIHVDARITTPQRSGCI